MSRSSKKIAEASYADRVAAALAAWTHKPQAQHQEHQSTHALLDAVATLMDGSATIAMGGESQNPDIGVVAETYRTILSTYDPEGSFRWVIEATLLGKLLQGDWWRVMLKDESDARVFAALIIRFVTINMSTLQGRPICGPAATHALNEDLAGMLKTWLAPLVISDTFTVRDFAGALFGEAWCNLMYDDDPDECVMPRLIETTQPSFLPGRLSEGAEPEAQLLPNLDRV